MLALTMYSDDHDEKYTSSRSWITDWGWDNPTFVRNGLLFAYAGNDEEMFRCPTGVTTFLDHPDNSSKDYVAWTYSMNERCGVNWAGCGIYSAKEIIHSDQFLVFTDENAWKFPPYSNHPLNNAALGTANWASTRVIDAIGSYHLGADAFFTGWSNVSFGDGHVSRHHISETKELTVPPQCR